MIFPDGPVGSRHPDGSEFAPYTADDLKAQRKSAPAIGEKVTGVTAAGESITGSYTGVRRGDELKVEYRRRCYFVDPRPSAFPAGDVIVPPRPTEAEYASLPVLDPAALPRPEMMADRFGYPAEVGDQEWAKFVAGQAEQHTYLTGQTPGAYATHPAQLDIVGANGRRLIVRWVPEGVYVGGCLITDPAVADRLAEWITRESEDD